MAETGVTGAQAVTRPPGISFFDRRILLSCLVLVAVTVSAYLPVLKAPFAAIDDPAYVSENPVVLSGLTPGGVVWAFSTFHAANYHPLTWLSHMLDVTLFGAYPAGHHGTNLLLHAANTVLLCCFLAYTTGKEWESVIVAGLFALHPMHVESVAWIAQRKELLCAFFSLLALSAYARYALNPCAGRYWPVVASFLLALLSKPMAVTLPFLMLVVDRWPLEREGIPLRVRILEKAPLFALSAAACIVTVMAQVAGKGLTLTVREFTLRQRFESAALAAVAYLRKAVWPSDLAVYYPLPSEPFSPWAAWIAMAALLAASFLAWRYRKPFPWLPAGWFWFLGMLVPVIGIVRVGRQFMADRYTYLPYVGLFVVAVWAFSGLARRRALSPAWCIAVALLPLVALGSATWSQATVWRTNESLLREALESTRDNPFIESMMGRELASRGRLDEAIGHLENALRLSPDSPEAYNDLGIGLSMAGRFEEAGRYYREGIRRAPDAPNGYTNLALDDLKQGRPDEAIPLLEECLRRNPGNPVATGMLMEVENGWRNRK